jgi:hypothetical protein
VAVYVADNTTINGSNYTTSGDATMRRAHLADRVVMTHRRGRAMPTKFRPRGPAD